MKMKIELAFVLPGIADECDACVERLLSTLQGRPGIEDAHVETDADGNARLCLHFDPDVLPIDRIRTLAREAGAEIGSQYGHLTVPIDGIRHERQARLAEGVIEKVPGVLHAAASFGAKRIYVEFDARITSSNEVLKALPSAGVRQQAQVKRPEHGDDETHDHGGPFGERSELVFSLACGALTGAGWLVGRLVPSMWIATAIFVLAYGVGSWFTIQEVYVAIRGRRFEIDFLMLLAAVGAAVLGEWFEGSLLLFLFTFGHSLEGFAMSRAEMRSRRWESSHPKRLSESTLVVVKSKSPSSS